MLVMLLFLQNWRAVLIPMITIPVSLIATFAVMKLLGFTINTLTLFGLVLAIAIVVDDAIVVVEDCMRLLDSGKYPRKEAAIKAMEELKNVPQHIAIIMDGNRRWAKAQGKNAGFGHKQGAKNLEKIVIYANKIGLKYITVYAFSTENWKRTEEEVNGLMILLKSYYIV